MYTLRTRNVNTAFANLISNFSEVYKSAENETPAGWGIVRTESRNGPVLALDGPICVTYESPTERVLFNPGRDCNPFFHLVEAMWMLAGRNDLSTLKHYVSTFGDFSDDGKTLNGAYGYRWRHGIVNRNSPWETEVDQLNILINHLKSTPNTRRAVLQMWNVEDDLMKIDSAKDVCCNLCVVFQTRETYPGEPFKLDMTVYNRSNDLVWGMLGANVVHFSFLQEYVALACGYEVGRYHQISNNLHFYPEKVNLERYLDDCTDLYSCWESSGSETFRLPLFSENESSKFDAALKIYFTQSEGDNPFTHEKGSFIGEVLIPATVAFSYHKNRNYDGAISIANGISSSDWRTVCLEWLFKRKRKYNGKIGSK